MKDEDTWTVFVRSCHGEILTIGDITASSCILRFYSIVSAKRNSQFKNVTNEMPKEVKNLCYIGVIWLRK